MTKDYAVGDIAVVRKGSAGAEMPYVFAKVLAVGPSKIKTDKGDFSAKSGKRWGETGWYTDRLEDISMSEAAAENKGRIAEQQRQKLANEIAETHWRNLTLAQLEAIKRILDGS